jgi:hypothetical protein
MIPSPARLHKNDKLWGAVAEALVAAYAMISAGGKLTSYRPFTDVDGKDIIIDLAGGFRDLYAQVKCTTGVNRNHRFGGTVRMRKDNVPVNPKLVYIFTVLDRRAMELTRIWVVPAAAFYRRAYRTDLANGMVQFNFDCHETRDEKWDEFEVTRQELGPKLVQLINRASRAGRPPRIDKRDQVPGRWLRLVA